MLKLETNQIRTLIVVPILLNTIHEEQEPSIDSSMKHGCALDICPRLRGLLLKMSNAQIGQIMENRTRWWMAWSSGDFCRLLITIARSADWLFSHKRCRTYLPRAKGTVTSISFLVNFQGGPLPHMKRFTRIGSLRCRRDWRLMLGNCSSFSSSAVFLQS